MGREDEQIKTQQKSVDDDLNDLTLQEKPTLQPRENVKIVAIDLQPMAHLDGIVQLKADITHPSTVPLLLKALDPDFNEDNETHRVDLVISDGAPDVTGLHDLDIYVQSQLLHSALALAMKVLRPGGKFVAKIFRGKNVDLIYAQLKLVFERVHVAKPRSSRASSIEAFIVCENYKPVPGWTPEIGDTMKAPEPKSISNKQTRRVREDGVVEIHFDDEEGDPKRWIAPFLACGDLSAWDSDATYKLPPGHVSLPPVQPPTAPPYKEAIERRRREGGAYGKTKDRSQPQVQLWRRVEAMRTFEIHWRQTTQEGQYSTLLQFQASPHPKPRSVPRPRSAKGNAGNASNLSNFNIAVHCQPLPSTSNTLILRSVPQTSTSRWRIRPLPSPASSYQAPPNKLASSLAAQVESV